MLCAQAACSCHAKVGIRTIAEILMRPTLLVDTWKLWSRNFAGEELPTKKSSTALLVAQGGGDDLRSLPPTMRSDPEAVAELLHRGSKGKMWNGLEGTSYS
jgi:hypothetical protein